jgi:hypothetical protein
MRLLTLELSGFQPALTGSTGVTWHHALYKRAIMLTLARGRNSASTTCWNEAAHDRHPPMEIASSLLFLDE